MLKYKKNIKAICVAIVAFLFLVTGCSQAGSSNSFGTSIPENAAKASLADIIANPSDFNEKDVVIEGVISGQCAALCRFYLKSGTDVVEMFPVGFTPPKLSNGTSVRVYTSVASGSERIVLSVIGMELKGGNN